MKVSKQQIAAELMRRSLPDFAQLTHPALSLTPFHRNYYRMLELFATGRIRRLIVTIPPQHGKSLASTVLLPAYVLGLNPSTRIAIASYNLSLAAKFNRRIQRLLEEPLYRKAFPATRLKSNARSDRNYIRTNEEFELLDAGGGVLSVGREGALTGNAVDLFVLDDLYKDALEANSPLIRENTWEWYNAVVRTRLHNHSQEMIVFTRWHEEDLIGRIETKEQVITVEDPEHLPPVPEGAWLKLNFAAVKTGDPTPIDPRQAGEALWPERHGLPLLEQKRRMDPILFEALYQGNPASREGLLYSEPFATYTELPDDLVKRANYTDTADTGEDFLCSVCYGVGRDGRLYVTEVVYSQAGMEVTEGLVAEMLRRNETRIACIESNNGGRGFARAVGKLTPAVKIEWFHQSRNKESRILSNATQVLRQVVFPHDWQMRWGAFHQHLSTYRRTFRSNRWHDGADVVTGMVEKEASGNGKQISAIRFSAHI